MDKKLLRIVDANFNRAKEGLRVCEDVCRFALDEPHVSRQYKDIRHKVTEVVERLGVGGLIEARDVRADVGKKTSRSESRREKIADVFFANAQRTKESIRVLEECAKLLNTSAAESLKQLRYRVYVLEQRTIRKF